jgi:hypothetical protein
MSLFYQSCEEDVLDLSTILDVLMDTEGGHGAGRARASRQTAGSTTRCFKENLACAAFFSS